MSATTHTHYEAVLQARRQDKPFPINMDAGMRPNCLGATPVEFDNPLDAALWASNHHERFPGNRWPADYGIRRVTKTTVQTTETATDMELL